MYFILSQRFLSVELFVRLVPTKVENLPIEVFPSVSEALSIYVYHHFQLSHVFYFGSDCFRAMIAPSPAPSSLSRCFLLYLFLFLSIFFLYLSLFLSFCFCFSLYFSFILLSFFLFESESDGRVMEAENRCFHSYSWPGCVLNCKERTKTPATFAKKPTAANCGQCCKTFSRGNLDPQKQEIEQNVYSDP